MQDEMAGEIDRILEAICDGHPIDWKMSPATTDRRFEQLRRLESIANAFRTPIPVGEGDAAGLLVDAETTEVLGIGAATSTRGATWGPLRVLESLGRGGFGEVFRAYDPSLRREVALKLVRPQRGGDDDTTQRMVEEARRLARVRHPNVLVVHGVAEHAGQVGIWADLVRGKTLAELVQEQGPLGAREATLVGIELCGALAALHASGLVHRDVKPANVMREQGGRIVLMDFGSVAERTSEEAAMRIEGTPILMAPEILLHGAAPGPRSDLYSLGALLYWVVSGTYPIEAQDLKGVVEKHRKRELVPLRDVRADLPASFVRIVERALDADPTRRYASMGEMERDLVSALGAAPGGVSAPVPAPIPVPAADPAPPTPTPASFATMSGASTPQSASEVASRLRRRKIIIAAGVAAAAAVVAAFTTVFIPRLSPPLQAEAVLYRVGLAGQDERIARDGAIHSGDEIYLEITTNRRMTVYVLNQDARGNIVLLYPPDLDAARATERQALASGVNRVPPNTGSRTSNWPVETASGTETILVLGAKRPDRDLEREISKCLTQAPGRSIGKVVQRDKVPQLTDLERQSRQRGLWTWDIPLKGH